MSDKRLKVLAGTCLAAIIMLGGIIGMCLEISGMGWLVVGGFLLAAGVSEV